MSWTRLTTAAVLAALSLSLASPALAAEKRYPEPPPPARPGNPFPRNPEPRLTNPLPRDTRDYNPQRDPDVERGYREHQQWYWGRQR